VAQLHSAVAEAKRDYQACRYRLVLDALPELLDLAQATCETSTGEDQLHARVSATHAYQVAGSIMLKLGDQGLAAFAAQRSMDTALSSQDPVAVAVSARTVTHTLMSAGHPERAREVAELGAKRLAGNRLRSDKETLSVYGALILRGAVAAALCGNRAGALQMMDEAVGTAGRIGRDDNAHWTAFGPTNVLLHRVHVARVLGDAGTAIDHARSVDLSKVTLAERKATLFLDTAQAFAQWGKHEKAYEALRMADQVAPEEVRGRRAVHHVIADLAVRAPGRIRAKVRDFANEIGIDL
jgi:hypothetical protein